MCVEFGFTVWIFLTTYTKLTRLISENYIAPVVELINAIFAFILQKNILQLQAFFRVLELITLIWCGLVLLSIAYFHLSTVLLLVHIFRFAEKIKLSLILHENRSIAYKITICDLDKKAIAQTHHR